ncbi:hypothetical protein QJS10_CPA08g00392 [Acorus calamus]|uniref:Uncharacterized protein n=1 Tax=Acorus calamus TaxID=4465 RepID=A0AAV9EDE3_ACOCL|nr:hypothetical protein QJS10_CPA08g00392 [Acorus calamus]
MPNAGPNSSGRASSPTQCESFGRSKGSIQVSGDSLCCLSFCGCARPSSAGPPPDPQA